jgi:hypothetical protein
MSTIPSRVLRGAAGIDVHIVARTQTAAANPPTIPVAEPRAEIRADQAVWSRQPLVGLAAPSLERASPRNSGKEGDVIATGACPACHAAWLGVGWSLAGWPSTVRAVM